MAAAEFLSAEFSRVGIKGKFRGRKAGFWRKDIPPPQTLTGDRLSREGRGFSTKGRKALVLSLKLAINRVSWSSGGGGREEARCSLFSRLI